MEDLTDALENRRIFWMGEEYEATKKRKVRSATYHGERGKGGGPVVSRPAAASMLGCVHLHGVNYECGTLVTRDYLGRG